MAIEVDFITLGEASTRLNVASGTLRQWADVLEEFGVHYVCRNNRNERIFYESDLDIFAFLRDLKAEYGRRTTNRDLASLLVDRAKQGEFTLRTKEDAPLPSQPSNRTADLLNQEDIKRLMESERVRQFLSLVIGEATQSLRVELMEDIREAIREEVRAEMMENNVKVMESLGSVEDSLGEVEKKLKENSDSDKSITDEIANIKKSVEETNSLVTESIKESRTERIKREQQEAARIQEEEKKPRKGFISKWFRG